MKKIKKQLVKKFGDHYLLGINKDGRKVYLEAASWDCDWYWGFGYIHTFTNNNNIAASRDIESHTHFNSLFLKNNIYDSFINYFDSCVLDDQSIWTLLELMKTFYTLRDYSDFIYRGGSHITSKGVEDLKDKIKDNEYYKYINNNLIPGVLTKVYEMLKPEA